MRKGRKGSEEVAGLRKCPPVRESREGRRREREKMGQRRGLGQKKMPAGEGSHERGRRRKGRKWVREEGWAKENARR
ncbi:MAG: hypothetical protein ACLR23_23545 [Clostridia bacterium]